MHSLFATTGSCTEGMRLQSPAPPGGVAKESSLIAPETHPPPSASARFCATFWYERGRSNAQDAPIVLYTFAPWVKGGDCGRRTRTKEGRGRWRASASASPLGENKTPFPTMISHPPHWRGKDHRRERASKGPPSANFTDPFRCLELCPQTTFNATVQL